MYGMYRHTSSKLFGLASSIGGTLRFGELTTELRLDYPFRISRDESSEWFMHESNKNNSIASHPPLSDLNCLIRVTVVTNDTSDLVHRGRQRKR